MGHPAPRKYATTTPKQVRALLNQGVSLREIADRLDVSLHGLRETCSLFGWRPRPKVGIEPLHKAIKITDTLVYQMNKELR